MSSVGSGRLRSIPGSLRHVGWSRHSSDDVLGEHADDRVPRHLVGAAADARQPDDCRGPPDMGSAEAEAGPETPAADDERVDPQGRPEGAEDRTVLYGYDVVDDADAPAVLVDHEYAEQFTQQHLSSGNREFGRRSLTAGRAQLHVVDLAGEPPVAIDDLPVEQLEPQEESSPCRRFRVGHYVPAFVAIISGMVTAATTSSTTRKTPPSTLESTRLALSPMYSVSLPTR